MELNKIISILNKKISGDDHLKLLIEPQVKVIDYQQCKLLQIFFLNVVRIFNLRIINCKDLKKYMI